MGRSAGPDVLSRWAHLIQGAAAYPRVSAAQWLAPEAVQELQWQRLRRMLWHAYSHSPLYRQRFQQAGLTPDTFRSIVDLRRLPITTREDLRQPDRLLADNFRRGNLRSSMTSGSTGRRTTSYFDEAAWVHAKHLLKLRARRACGMRLWDRVALFQEDAPDRPRFGAITRAQAFTIHRPIEEILPDVRRFAPTVLYGFPGHLLRLAETAAGSLRPRLVFTSGELLDAMTRRAIEARFGAPVFDVYGCTEIKEIAWECPAHEGYHLNADAVLVETEPADAPGRLLITSLTNFAMPLLRYQVGDTGELLPDRCSCGRGLPLIRPTLGRTVDYLRLPDGSVLTPYSLTCAVEAIEGMRQYQFVQVAADLIVLRIVPGDEFGDDERRAVHAALMPVLPGMTIRIETLTTIPPEPSGKYRIVQSRLGRDGIVRAGTKT